MDSHRDTSPAPAVSTDGRGRLIVENMAAQRVAVQAALRTPGVHAHAAGGLSKLTGRGLPRARVVIATNRARAHLDIAVTWSRPLPDVARAVQHNVAEDLTVYTGLHIDRVDVAITQILDLTADVALRNT